ncbi:MAG: hypothetical protein AB7S41_07365 [Parvibaculaceae bacterium]
MSFTVEASAQQFNRQQFRAERQQGNNGFKQFAGPKVQQNRIDPSQFQRISAPKAQKPVFEGPKVQQGRIDPNRFQRFSPPKAQNNGPKVQFAAPPKVQNNGPKVQFAAPPKVQQPRDNGFAEFQAPKAPRNQQFVAPKAQRSQQNFAEFEAQQAPKRAKVASLEQEVPVEKKSVAQLEQPAETVEQPAAEAQEAPAVAKVEDAGKDFVVEYQGGYYKVRKFSDGKVTLLGVAEGYGEQQPVKRYKAPTYSHSYSYGYSQSAYGYGDNCQNGY